ncbi:MAG: protease inhibitor I42 family protein [Thermoleophilia bacterium]
MRISGKLTAFLLIFALAIAAAGCGGDSGTTGDTGTSTQPEQDKFVVFDESFNNSSVEIRTGVRMELILAGNPTTGYNWTVESDGAPVLRQMGEPVYRADSDDPDIAGSGGTYTWKFEVVTAGAADLKLVYRQSWDMSSPPGETFDLSIKATGPTTTSP